MSRRRLLLGAAAGAAAAMGFALPERTGPGRPLPEFVPPPEPTPGVATDAFAPVTPAWVGGTVSADPVGAETIGDWYPSSGNVTDVAAVISPRSVLPGELLRVRIAARARRADMSIYRMGWYSGSGAILCLHEPGIRTQPLSSAVGDRRLVSTDWVSSFDFRVPDDWKSGSYLARLETPDRLQHLAPFWVRSGVSHRPILVLSGLLTSAAYSAWGGAGLYPSTSGSQRAYAVSLDRPFSQNWGAGDFLTWEYPFLRWFERSGFDGDYACDLDLHADPAILKDRRLVILAGHHEYYTNEMRAGLDDAVSRGANLALFGSNALYWRVRLEDSPAGQRRTVVCYKDASSDPLGHGPEATTRFRDQPYPNPEAALLGVQHERTNATAAPWVATGTGHWAYEGTGFEDGDAIPGAVGPEYDCIFPGACDRMTTVLGDSPLVNDAGKASHSQTTLTSAPGLGTVFASGSANWPLLLDAFRAPGGRYAVQPDARAQQLARNIIRTLAKPRAEWHA